MSQRLSLYPSGLCSFLARLFVDGFLNMQATGQGPTGWHRSEVAVPRVSNWSLEATSTQAQGVAILNECAARGSKVVVDEAKHAFYLHVDDGVFVATQDEVANSMMHESATALEDIGFIVSERTEASACLKVIGFEVERHPARLRVPVGKASLLVRSMLYLVSQFRVNTGHVRSVLGIWVWASMLRREALSAASNIFHFVQHFDGEEATWWPTARREFKHMAGLVHALYADAGAQLAPYVYATDAQGADDAADCGGWGIVGTPVTKVYGEFLYSRGTRPGRNITKLDGTMGTRHATTLEPTIPFTQLPESLFGAKRRWDFIGAGRWGYADHITLGESRAVLKLFMALAAHVSAHRSKVLSLQDNMPTAYGWARGRSSAPAINYLLRRRAAHCIGAEIAGILPWVETSLQPADDASRARVWPASPGPAPGGQDHGDDDLEISKGSGAFRRVAH